MNKTLKITFISIAFLSIQLQASLEKEETNRTLIFNAINLAINAREKNNPHYRIPIDTEHTIPPLELETSLKEFFNENINIAAQYSIRARQSSIRQTERNPASSTILIQALTREEHKKLIKNNGAKTPS